MLRQRTGFVINRLISGGIITNYYCSSRCKHCLYACSPRWERKYISKETTRKNLLKIKELGCYSIHVGGGEPFLNVEGLRNVIETARESGVRIEYVETNSSWYKERSSALSILSSLKKAGLSTLLVSISPFHSEYIPLRKVKGVIRACEEVGIQVFPWISEFLGDIEVLGENTVHKLSEYEEAFGPGYLRNLPSRYWIHFGGRAVKSFSKVLSTRPLDIILEEGAGGCSELLKVDHFHVDLFGNYIPGLCAGLAIHRDDLGSSLSEEKYPFLSTLFNHGVSALYNAAKSQYGFEAASEYMSKCHLCLEIRQYLVSRKGVNTPDLQPSQFYENL